MSRCAVCSHPSVAAIDVALLEGRAARRVAGLFSLSYDSTVRHARNHVVREAPTVAPETGGPLVELIAALRARALKGDPVAAREYRVALATQAAAAANVVPAVKYTDDPEWPRFLELVLRTLEPYPEARYALANAMREELGETPIPWTPVP